MRLDLQPWQIGVLTRLDDLWLAAWRKGRPAPPPVTSKKG